MVHSSGLPLRFFYQKAGINMQRLFFRTCLYMLSAIFTILAPSKSHATSKEQLLVDRAALAVQSIFVDSAGSTRAGRYLRTARAVMICPSLFRMSLVFGGSGGGCVLLARDAQGSWSDPAFYTLSNASFGFQLGVESSQMMFFIMSDRGLQALLDSQFKFEAGASASFANVGSGIQSGSAGARNTDILALQKSSGLYAGASLGGTKLTSDSSANRAYYGQLVGPESIVISMRVNNSGADPLRRALIQYSKLSGSSSKPVKNTASGRIKSDPDAENPVGDDDFGAAPPRSRSKNDIQVRTLPAKR